MRLSLRYLTNKRSPSSSRWLQRSRNDPFRTSKATSDNAEHYVSRSAHKLLTLDYKYRFLKPGATIVELGAAPGGWCQIAMKRMRGQGSLIAVDLLPLDNRVTTSKAAKGMLHHIQGDIRSPEIRDNILQSTNGRPVDIVMSDMLANTSGNMIRDQQSSLDLCQIAHDLAIDLFERPSAVTDNDATLVMKILQSPEATLFAKDILTKSFRIVRWEKPMASATASSEMYLVCQTRRDE